MNWRRNFWISKICPVILLAFVVAAAGCTPAPIITPDQAGSYINQTVQIKVTPVEEISSDTRLSFFIFIPMYINTGKTRFMYLMPIPIFSRYRLYRTEELIYLGIELKNQSLELGKTVLVTGKIVQDKESKMLAVLRK